MTIQHLPKNNLTLPEFGIKKPLTEKPVLLFSVNYHHKFLKNLYTISFYDIIDKILFIHTYQLINNDLKILLKHYDKKLIEISTEHNTNSILIKIYLECDKK